MRCTVTPLYKLIQMSSLNSQFEVVSKGLVLPVALVGLVYSHTCTVCLTILVSQTRSPCVIWLI